MTPTPRMLILMGYLPPEALRAAGYDEETCAGAERLSYAARVASKTGFIPARNETAAKTRRLTDGSTGWYVRGQRIDDCYAAAIATTLQVPIDAVPDPRIAERLRVGEDPEQINRSAWQQMTAWLAERGLRIVVHEDVADVRGRWIGVIAVEAGFHSHCLCMLGRELLFDPIDPSVHDRPVRVFSAEDIAYGFTFDVIPHERNEQ